MFSFIIFRGPNLNLQLYLFDIFFTKASKKKNYLINFSLKLFFTTFWFNWDFDMMIV